jgi:O-methyltransferase domain
MTASSHAVAQAIHEVFDFSSYKTVVDVAGGQGAFLTSILDRSPQSRGILYDLPPVIAHAPAHPRIEPVPGDIFTSVPEGGDLYILKWIIHDWEEAKAIQILKNVHRAMQPTGTLIVVEGLISESNSQPGPDMIKWMDMNMLVMTGGRERTEAEYRKLLTGGGFQLDRDSPRIEKGLNSPLLLRSRSRAALRCWGASSRNKSSYTSWVIAGFGYNCTEVETIWQFREQVSESSGMQALPVDSAS